LLTGVKQKILDSDKTSDLRQVSRFSLGLIRLSPPETAFLDLQPTWQFIAPGGSKPNAQSKLSAEILRVVRRG
jgi:hypothetical protein